MHDSMRVGFVERTGDLDSDPQRFIEQQRSPVQAVGEGLTFEVLHHQKIHPILRADIVQRANVRMVQRGDRVRFALQPLFQVRVRGEMCR